MIQTILMIRNILEENSNNNRKCILVVIAILNNNLLQDINVYNFIFTIDLGSVIPLINIKESRNKALEKMKNTDRLLQKTFPVFFLSIKMHHVALRLSTII